MRKSQNKIVQIFISIVLLGLMMSCENRPKNVLSPDKMEKLLVDIHILEGSLNSMGYAKLDDEERKAYFESIFQDYGISVSDFDSCLVWYSKNPKKFERLYIKVNNQLSKIEKDVEANLYHLHDTIQERDIWYKTKRHIFGPDSTRTQLNETLNIASLLPNDRYELSFLHRIAPSDSSINHHAVMYINYKNGEIDSIYTKTENDSTLRRITMRLKARKMESIQSLQVKFLGVDSTKGEMNAIIDSIKLLRIFNPQREDSIRAYLEKMDTTKTEKKDSLKSKPKKEKKDMQQIKLEIESGDKVLAR